MNSRISLTYSNQISNVFIALTILVY